MNCTQAKKPQQPARFTYRTLTHRCRSAVLLSSCTTANPKQRMPGPCPHQHRSCSCMQQQSLRSASPSLMRKGCRSSTYCCALRSGKPSLCQLSSTSHSGHASTGSFRITCSHTYPAVVPARTCRLAVLCCKEPGMPAWDGPAARHVPHVYLPARHDSADRQQLLTLSPNRTTSNSPPAVRRARISHMGLDWAFTGAAVSQHRGHEEGSTAVLVGRRRRASVTEELCAD